MRHGAAAGPGSQDSMDTGASTIDPISGSSTGCSTKRAVRSSFQRQEAPERLPSLPVELLELVLSFVDKSNWPAVYRTCKQWHDWVATHAASGWSSRVETRLFLEWGTTWSWPTACYPQHYHWINHVHTPTYVMVPDESERLAEFLQSDASMSSSIRPQDLDELQLHVSAPTPPPKMYEQVPTPQPVYAQSWISLFLSPQYATPAVAACFSHIHTIRLQDVQLTHPLPECIRRVCSSLRRYSLQNVVWPEHIKPGKPWPQLQQLSIGTATSTTGTAQLPQLINSTILPGLQTLYISNLPIAGSVCLTEACCAAFRNQLVTLSCCSGIAFRSPGSTCTSPTATFPCSRKLILKCKVADFLLDALLAAAPALEHLKVDAMQLYRSLAHVQCKLQHLEVQHWPEFVATLGRLPNMPELTHITLPRYPVFDQPPEKQHVAAAVAVVQHFGNLQSPLNLAFEGAGSAEVKHMRTLGPLLQALCQKSVNIWVFYEGVDRSTLRALGAAAIPRVEFDACQWNPPTLLDELWELMPHTNEVCFIPRHDEQQPASGLHEILVLCRGATRPVTVYLSGLSKELQLARDILAAEGNKLVRVQPGWGL